MVLLNYYLIEKYLFCRFRICSCKRQQELFNALDNYFNDVNKEIILFNVTPRKPIDIPLEMDKYGAKIVVEVDLFISSRSLSSGFANK